MNGVYDDIITGKLKARTIHTAMGRCLEITGYNKKKMYIFEGDVISCFGEAEQAKHVNTGRVLGWSRVNAITLALPNGAQMYVNPIGCICIVKYVK